MYCGNAIEDAVAVVHAAGNEGGREGKGEDGKGREVTER